MGPHTKRRRGLFAAALVAITGGLAIATNPPVSADATPPSDDGIVPILVPGNPSCPAGTIELKVEPVVDGTYSDGTLTVNIDVTGAELAWASNIGVDVVIVKGGPNGNVYVYQPPAESTGDSGLFAPDNPSGDPAGLSHISFCYDVELNVTKTAVTSYNRDWDWAIDKSVDPTSLDMFQGQTGTVTWRVDVTRTGPQDSGHAVSGNIVISNPSATTAATVTGVSDVISGGINAAVVCPSAFPFSVPAGGSVTCTYSSPLPNADQRVNTATVTTSGAIQGGSGTAAVVFGAPTTETDASINVSDTVAGNLGAFTGSGTVSYTSSYTCNQDAGSHSNTATIPPTSDQGAQSDTATTVVNCYGLTVNKTATTSQTRTFNWDVIKTANVGSIVLLPNDTLEVTFSVRLLATSALSNFGVAGTIQVTNPAPIPATLDSVTDTISGGINAAVDCGVTFPVVLAPGATLTCAYAAPLPDGSNRTNTATATAYGVPYSGSAPVTFAGATTNEVTRCVTLSDSQFPTLAALFDAVDGTVDGQFCLAAGATSVDVTRSYTKTLSFPECGPTQYSNTVSLNTGATSTVVIPVDVPCDTGCTLTIGYWKTHSQFGPAPTDPAWYSIGDADGDGVSEGPNETFFLSGQTWYQVFWTAPAGNVYYVLAHQYMGARLNIANGASTTPAVTAAIAAATTFFQTTTPAQAASLKGAAKTTITNLAGTLASYNEGTIGPGHCSENIAGRIVT